MAAVFDGTRAPTLHVSAAFGEPLDPGATYLHLGVGPGLGTGMLGGAVEVDISDDVRSISISQRGRPTDHDTASPVTCSIVLSNRSGDYDPSNTGGPYFGDLDDGVPIRVRAVWDGVAYQRFYGELVDIQLGFDLSGDATATFTCLDGFEKLGRAYLPAAAALYDGDTTGERIGHLADEASWPSSLRLLDTGYTLLARTTLGGNALDLMQTTATTEYGLLFIDGSGRLVFYDRHHGALETHSTVIQASFTDSGGVGMQGFILGRNRDDTFNRVAITRDPAPSEPFTDDDGGAGEDSDEPTEQVADDSAGIAAKGILAFTASVGQLSRNDSSALALGEYLVQRYSTTQNRITEIRVNGMRGDWATVLALGPLDRVEVERDYGPNTISVDLHIQGVAEQITVAPASWELTFSTSNLPPTPSFWVLGDATDGKLGTAGLAW